MNLDRRVLLAGLAGVAAAPALAQTAPVAVKPGTGIAIQIDVEDAVGVMHQVEKLTQELEDKI